MDAINRIDNDLVPNPYQNLSQTVLNDKLIEAAETGNLSEVTLLIQNDADIHATNNFGNALMFACSNGHTDTAAFLFEKGADIHATDNFGNNALMYACSNGHTATAAFLLEKGADIHAINNEGNNALMVACRDKHRNNALKYVCSRGDTETACLLLHYMTPEEREAFANQSYIINRMRVDKFKNSVKEHALVVYEKMRTEHWKIEPNSIFRLLPTELRNYIRSFEAQLDFKEKFKDSWYRFRAFSEMNTVAQYCASSHVDKPIFPVLFLSDKRKAQGEPGEGNNPNKKRLLTEKGNGNRNQFP